MPRASVTDDDGDTTPPPDGANETRTPATASPCGDLTATTMESRSSARSKPR
jgi:hypothetical protein